VTVVGLTACAVGPDYVRPQTPEGGAWTAPLQGGLVQSPVDSERLAKFWTALDDPVLTGLVERAVSGGSLTVQQAQARVRQARALRKVAIGEFFPTVTGNAQVEREHIVARTSGIQGTLDLYSATLDASWEIDVFGKLRRNLEAATADRDSAIWDLRDVLVTLSSEIALAYVDMRSLQERIRIAEATLASQSETFDLTNWRAMAGLTTYLDVERARTSVETTRATIPSFRQALAADQHSIAVLIGEAPGAVEDLLRDPKPIPLTPTEVAVGVPADTLSERPDVRAAERSLAAETARIGVVTASAYPSLNALGTIGLEALSPGGLFRAGAWTGALVGTASETIFQGGQIMANIEAQNAVRDQALAAYQSAVLTALQDVEDALVAYSQEQDRRKALAAAVTSADLALTMAQQQYGSGLIDFQDVLDAQRSLFVLQDQLASSEGLVTSNLIRLYKALGGGWVPEAQS